jgi:hypothetical protein
VALVILLVAFLFALGTIHALWVPLVTDHLGSTLVDGLWTPLTVKLALAGLGVAGVGALTVAALWMRDRRRP